MEIVVGKGYTYNCPVPPDCSGHLYAVMGFATHVPTYQRVVVTCGLTGPDTDKLFVCSLANFTTRFVPAPEELPK